MTTRDISMPSNWLPRRAARSIAASLLLALAGSPSPAVEKRVTVLASPEFPPAAHLVEADLLKAFVEISSTPNGTTDTDKWFERHEFGPLRLEDAPDEMERSLRELEGVAGVHLNPGMKRLASGGDARILVSGPHRGDDDFLAAFDPANGTFRYAFDFSAYLFPPPEGGREVDRDLYPQEVTWAVEDGGILYVSHRHRGYAKDSLGKNAYVTAIDLERKAVAWRSPALVANAENFLLHGEYLVTGYGFTAEPDFLYLLRRKDGAIAARARLKSAPEVLIEKDGRLYVRCYDTDAVFRLAIPKTAAE